MSAKMHVMYFVESPDVGQLEWRNGTMASLLNNSNVKRSNLTLH